MTHRPAGRSYFYRLWELTPRLTELDLSGCGWLDSHALLPLSKLARLQRLTLRDCRRLGGEVAYSSIACMLGFRALRTLDVRRTQVADSDVSGFCQLPRLAELLLEPRRAGLVDGDAAVRHLGQHRGAELRRLALRRCPLRDHSVQELPRLLPELAQLDLTGAGVSAVRRGWLAGQLAGCVVSCHVSKQADPDPEPAQGQARRRRRSQSPADGGDSAPPAKRPRHQACRCVRCAAGSDGEEEGEDAVEEDDDEGEGRAPEDLENQPGVIVVNLFDARQAVLVRNGNRAAGGDAAAGGRQAGEPAPGGVDRGEDGAGAEREEEAEERAEEEEDRAGEEGEGDGVVEEREEVRGGVGEDDARGG